MSAAGREAKTTPYLPIYTGLGPLRWASSGCRPGLASAMASLNVRSAVTVALRNFSWGSRCSSCSQPPGCPRRSFSKDQLIDGVEWLPAPFR